MTTWTPLGIDAETWTSQSPGANDRHGFSTLGFSRAMIGGKRAFSMNSPSGNTETWDNVSNDTESWTPA